MHSKTIKRLFMLQKKFFQALFVFSLFIIDGYGQQIGINEDGSLPNPNAIVDINSVKKGLPVPRMSTTSRLVIPVTKGLLVYDATTQSFWYHTGNAWQNINPGSYEGATWLLAGNAGTTSNDFPGTADDGPLRIRIHNEPSGLVECCRSNTFLGYSSGALANPDSIYYCTGIGARTLYQNGNGTGNTATGYSAMSHNTTGDYNTSAGTLSMYSNTTGNNNTATGSWSLYSNTTGSNNIANGVFALYSNTTGNNNIASGTTSLYYNTTGGANTAYGANSMLINTSGSLNTAYGSYSLVNNTTGTGNTSVGAGSLFFNTTGSYNTAVGYAADTGPGYTNSTAIGYQAFSGASNKLRLGNAAVTRIEGQVPFTTPSDGRFKYDVQEDIKGLDFIMQLRPVTYRFDVKRFDEQQREGKNNIDDSPEDDGLKAAYSEAAAIRRSGFIAQEVEKAALKAGYDFSGLLQPKNEKDHYSLSYESFVVPLVKAVQQQQEIINAQQRQIEKIMQKLEKLETTK